LTLKDNSTNKAERVRFLKEEVFTGSTFNINYIMTGAKQAAIATYNYLRDNSPAKIIQQKALGINTVLNRSCLSYSGVITCSPATQTLEYTLDARSGAKLAISLQDLGGLMRISLAKIHLLKDAYSGSELLYRRWSAADTDLATVKILRNGLAEAINQVNTWALEKAALEYNNAAMFTNNNNIYYGQIVQINRFNDFNKSQIIDYWGAADGKRYKDTGFTPYEGTFEGSLVSGIAPNSFVVETATKNQNLKDAMLYVTDYSGQLNKFREYFILYSSLLARWEIELTAHKLAYTVTQ
jgi:hypothetical protein